MYVLYTYHVLSYMYALAHTKWNIPKMVVFFEVAVLLSVSLGVSL